MPSCTQRGSGAGSMSPMCHNRRLRKERSRGFMYLDRFKLDGRVALITGGNRGLGFVMARALAEAGADVVVTGRKIGKAQESAAAIAEATGRRAIGLTIDVTDAQ